MGLFGNKREKAEKVDKYEYHSTSKGGRSSAYGPTSPYQVHHHHPFLQGQTIL